MRLASSVSRASPPVDFLAMCGSYVMAVTRVLWIYLRQSVRM
jgi:hypothetical protein